MEEVWNAEKGDIGSVIYSVYVSSGLVWRLTG